MLTASGAALGLWAVILTLDGYFQEALWVLAAAVFIDSVDGTMARRINVSRHAPLIRGDLLENIVDFVTWTLAPLFWAYAVVQVPAWVVLGCTLTSALQFSHADAKSEDHFFTGFPSYWNIVVLYLYLLELPPEICAGVLLIFAVVTLLPVRFVYPTRTPHLQTLTLALGGIYFAQLLALVILLDSAPVWLVYSSFLFPFYYFGLSLYLNARGE
ncbi:MAG: CDP-alcohol phosphatidyltransferase family protein [Balneolaceae bacterium]|nr:CDP-alcohol phosphatidyltransferase family protein [Balneolaceae bacterium]